MGFFDFVNPNNWLPRKFGAEAAASITEASSTVSHTIEAVGDKTLAQVEPLIGPTVKLTDAAANATSVLSYSMGFSHVGHGLTAMYTAYIGQRARDELTRFERNVVEGLDGIVTNLESTASTLDRMSNHAGQGPFHEHVHSFVAMHSQLHPHARIFVYHPGTYWIPSCWKLLQCEPLLQLHGIFSDFNVMLLWLRFYRKALSKALSKASARACEIHILLPAARTIVLPTSITLDTRLRPIGVFGQLNETGEPYVYVNMPNAAPSEFRHVANIREIRHEGGETELVARDTYAEEDSKDAMDRNVQPRLEGLPEKEELESILQDSRSTSDTEKVRSQFDESPEDNGE